MFWENEAQNTELHLLTCDASDLNLLQRTTLQRFSALSLQPVLEFRYSIDFCCLLCY